MKEYIGIVITLVLTGLGIFFKDSQTLALSLFLVAGAVLIYLVCKWLIEHLPRLYITGPRAEAAMQAIYREASKHGGRLISTHISPWKTHPSDDIVLETLKKVEGALDYERFIYIEDNEVEEQWIRNTLSKLDQRMNVSVYSLRPLPFIPPVLWSVIPRVNMLLYNRGSTYRCLVGLDRLHRVETRYSEICFSVLFRSKRAFQTLFRYFQAVTVSHQIVCDKGIVEFDKRQRPRLISPKVQSILLDVVTFTRQCPNLVHAGLFGNRALALAGIIQDRCSEEHEADIDVLLIAETGQKERAKETVCKALGERDDIKIVWGDNLEYFYEFRDTEKITIDIELFERGSGFYTEHPLLGHSILFRYYTLYRKEREESLLNLLSAPPQYVHRENRMDLCLKDRKGLLDFEQNLATRVDTVDPRRVIAHCVQNIAWAISGSRPLNAFKAMRVISTDARWKLLTQGKRYADTLQLALGAVRSQYRQHRQVAEELVSSAIELAQREIQEKVGESH